MTELTNLQLTQLLINQNETIQSIFKKKMPKTILKDIKPNVTIEEFIENIEVIPLTKLLTCTLPAYYVNTIMFNLEKLESKNIPMVCTDARQKKFYYFTDGEWKLDKNFMKKLQSNIFDIVVRKLVIMKNLTRNNEETCRCFYTFFDVETYPLEKLLDKIAVELGKKMPSITELDFSE